MCVVATAPSRRRVVSHNTVMSPVPCAGFVPPAVQDVNFLDDLLPSTFYDVTNMTTIAAAAIAAVTMASPWILIVIAVFLVVCVKLRNFYIRSSRKVRVRLQGRWVGSLERGVSGCALCR